MVPGMSTGTGAARAASCTSPGFRWNESRAHTFLVGNIDLVWTALPQSPMAVRSACRLRTPWPLGSASITSVSPSTTSGEKGDTPKWTGLHSSAFVCGGVFTLSVVLAGDWSMGLRWGGACSAPAGPRDVSRACHLCRSPHTGLAVRHSSERRKLEALHASIACLRGGRACPAPEPVGAACSWRAPHGPVAPTLPHRDSSSLASRKQGRELGAVLHDADCPGPRLLRRWT
eukprot:scaffold3_cov389-Prasinococcus_capsulatus_cf.AAC.21